MGGPVHQSSSGSHYDHNNVGAYPSAGATDAAMNKWMQSTGLRHFASPATSSSVDARPLSNQLPQDSAKHTNLEDRQKLFRLMRSISGGVDRTNEIFTPPRYDATRRNDGISSPELRGEIGGILDLQSIDDTELLSEVAAIHEPFEASPFVAITESGYEDEPEVLWPGKKPINKQKVQHDNSPIRASVLEKDFLGKDVSGGLARIKVVVRKRPLNKKEIARKEEDIVTIDNNGCSLSVHEPKLKVDLTAYVEKHDFAFDAVLDDYVSNDEVYQVTIQPIIPTVFQNTKATCFAYGQTGSGKTFTMQPLPLRACQDILDLMQHPMYRNQGLQLWLSFFEIYGGKLYDLLTDRRKLCMREDGRQQVCIVGLKEFPVSNVEIVKEFIEKGNASRSTGSTGANEESSRSHAILQLVIKKHSDKKDERVGKLVGKFSFIDLAGSERGADTTDNDRQTRIEGAEINKSLLALKECIRALDNEQGHIPFRGSKLTEVLRDSFVGDSRTVMISCISPNAGSCEHTLNTLRYADRVKGLSKNSNAKRDPSPNMGIQIQKDSTTAAFLNELSNTNDWRISESSNRMDEQSNCQTRVVQQENRTAQQGVIYQADTDRYRLVAKEQVSYVNYQYDSSNEQEIRRRAVKDERLERYESNDAKHNNITVRGRMPRKEEIVPCDTKSTQKDVNEPISQSQYYDHISAILEEEEDLISAHRLEVENTMELVREEMKLLTEVDQPGSRIDMYVSQLSHLLSRKAAGIVNLQARLARFQQHLKEQEILSRNMNNTQ